MIERPCAASALARARTSKAVSVPSTAMRPAICNIRTLPRTAARDWGILAPSLRRGDEEQPRVSEQYPAAAAWHRQLPNSGHCRRPSRDRNRFGCRFVQRIRSPHRERFKRRRRLRTGACGGQMSEPGKTILVVEDDREVREVAL